MWTGRGRGNLMRDSGPALTASAFKHTHTHAEDILLVAKPVEYAMAGVVGLSLLFLVVNAFFLLYFRKHKVRK